jgi:acyl-CoA synthetase (AMP-forming)/AMP-acid ligase II
MSSNFAAWLIHRMSRSSQLIDAERGVRIGTADGTSGSLAEAVQCTAAAFLKAGARAGQFVVLLMDISPESVLAYLGAMYAGCVVVPVDGGRDTASVTGIASQLEISAVWAPSGEAIARIDPGRALRLHGALVNEVTHRRGWRLDAGRGDALAALMPTSGSTGRPRLVRITHKNLIANTTDIVATQGLTSADRAMLALPLSYCFGASVLHSHLAVGGDVVLHRHMMFPDGILKAIAQHHCTTFAGVPTMYSLLLNRSTPRLWELPSLQRWLQAGGRLDPTDIDRVRALTPRAGFYVMYGQTEATARISCLKPGELDRKRGSVGRALPSLQLRAVPDTGEIIVSGPSVTDGYWNDPAATGERFREGWLWTGDRGRLDDEGVLWLEGRMTDVVKIAGVRVALADVEGRLRNVPGVQDAVAVGVPHAVCGEALAVFVVPKKDAAAAPLQRAMYAALPTHWMIASIGVLDDLPTNSHGKVDRSRLARLTTARS